jgi:hypothetical protein
MRDYFYGVDIVAGVEREAESKGLCFPRTQDFAEEAKSTPAISIISKPAPRWLVLTLDSIRELLYIERVVFLLYA